MFILTLIFLVFSIFTAFHMWKRVDLHVAIKCIIALIILISGIYGLIIYWIWFAIKRPPIIASYELNKQESEDADAEVLPDDYTGQQAIEATSAIALEDSQVEETVKKPTAVFIKSPTQVCSYERIVWFYNHAAENFPAEELRKKYLYLFINFLLNPRLTVDDKCRLLELNDQKLRELYPNHPQKQSKFYITGLLKYYSVLDKIADEEAVSQINADKAVLNQDIEDNTISSNPMTKYLQPIFVNTVLVRSHKKVSIDASLFNTYNIPTL